MVELYESKINQTEDLLDIADFLTEDAQYKKNILKYINNPFDADVERIGKGDTIYLVGQIDDDSDFQINNRTLDAILKAIEMDLITSAHHISSNGLFISLLECCAPNELGFDITGDAEFEDKEFLFGRSRHLAIITVNDSQENDLVDFLFNEEVPVTLLGHVTKGELRLDDLSFDYINDYIQE